MGDITDFYVGTTKKFTVTCKINGVAQDITGDTVTARLKNERDDPDESAALEITADVATQGASGVAIFEWEPSDTNIDPGTYLIDIVWELSGGEEYIIYNDKINAKERVSDAG